jgi:hypothetical protein
VYFPEWTSALRRLLRYPHTADRPRNDAFCDVPLEGAAAQAAWDARLAELQGAYARIKAAYALLGAGKAHAALRAFDSEMRFWRHDRNNGYGYIDTARGIVIAAIFAREDGRAGPALRALEREYGGEPAGDAFVFAGRWNDAFATYRDATRREVGAVGIDPVIAKGADAARAGDFRGAIAAWSRTSSGAGPAYVHDEQTALIGLALARIGDWDGAEDAWLDASRMGRAVPEWQPLWSGNLTALAMLYHFRVHFARGDGAYRFRIDVGSRA